ncbi:MAG: hypothetical protein O6924_09055 [Alphaproteobacteria bacterium]|nr:hypothetical protein [Alphaproteobacteria bacterium]
MATQAKQISGALAPAPGDIWGDGERTCDQRYGKPQFDRRLSDKILSVYNHAYAADEVELANKLRVLLGETESREIAHCERPGASVLDMPVRRNSSAVRQARLWTQFVDARQGYISLSIRTKSSAEQVKSAYDGMRTSYTRWTVS